MKIINFTLYNAMFRKIIILCSLIAGIIMQTQGSGAGEVIGWMQITPAGKQIEISGRAYALEGAHVDYSLQIERTGKSGKTATRQGGRADIEAGEVAKLSTTSVNIGSGDHLAISLTLSSGGKIVSTSAVQLGSQ